VRVRPTKDTRRCQYLLDTTDQNNARAAVPFPRTLDHHCISGADGETRRNAVVPEWLRSRVVEVVHWHARIIEPFPAAQVTSHKNVTTCPPQRTSADPQIPSRNEHCVECARTARRRAPIIRPSPRRVTGRRERSAASEYCSPDFPVTASRVRGESARVRKTTRNDTKH